MRERDARDERLAAQRRALENRLARERAILNKVQLEEEKKKDAEAMKIEVRLHIHYITCILSR